MEDPRTTTARDNDDSALIEGAIDLGGQQGRSGGNLARDVATAAEAARVADPEAHRGVEKSDEIAHGTDRVEDRPRAAD